MFERAITIVSGLPRSGTSLMMQMLAAGGLPVLTDDLRAADESNPRGYFEFEPVRRLRTDKSWLEAARGRALKIVHLLLRELPTNEGFAYRVIFMRRPMEEILTSQRAMLERQGRHSEDEAMLRKIFEQQIAEAESFLTENAGFSCLFVEYHRVIKNPGACAEQVNAFLGGDLNVTAMAGAVDPLLHRQKIDVSRKD